MLKMPCKCVCVWGWEGVEEFSWGGVVCVWGGVLKKYIFKGLVTFNADYRGALKFSNAKQNPYPLKVD